MSHADHPPQLPQIEDEAGDTPRWVPFFGLGLFVLIVAYVWWAHRQHEAAAEAADGDPTAQAQAH